MFTDIDETVKAAAIQIRLFKWDIWLTTSEQLDISELGKLAKRDGWIETWAGKQSWE